MVACTAESDDLVRRVVQPCGAARDANGSGVALPEASPSRRRSIARQRLLDSVPGRRGVRVIPVVVAVQNPLPNVAQHIVDSVCLGLLGPRRMRHAAAVFAVPGDLGDASVVGKGNAAARRVFPFRFGRQPSSDSGTVSLRVGPGNINRDCRVDPPSGGGRSA